MISYQTWSRGWKVVLLLAVLVRFGAAEEEPTPTPTPRATPTPKTLSDLARNLKLQQPDEVAADGDATTVISNETLYPDGEESRPPSSQPPPGIASEWDKEQAAKKEEWQKRFREQLQAVADLEAEMAALNKAIPKLQEDFYKWDDPFYRDAEIKPKLDQAMARRAAAEMELAKEKAATTTLLNEARRDGAQPGWFRGVKADKPWPRPAEKKPSGTPPVTPPGRDPG